MANAREEFTLSVPAPKTLCVITKRPLPTPSPVMASVLFHDQSLDLVISDDGPGFNIEAASLPPRHWGSACI